MKTLAATVSALLLLSFVSCQKEVDFDSPAGDPSPGNNSILLEKYIELDTTLPSGLDTSWKIIYTYDAQNRVQHSYEVDYYASGVPGSIGTTATQYFYSGNDSLPYKYIATYIDPLAKYRDTAFLAYINGLVSRDSVIEYDITSNQFFATSVAYYTVSGNNTLVLRREYDSPGISPAADEWNGVLMKTYQNGDIVTQDDPGTYPQVVYNDRAHCQVSYDNKPNPFYKAEIPYPVLDKWKVQKNNVLEETSWDVPSTIESHYTYTYTYRADGYPTIVRYGGTINNLTAKGLFFYKQ